MEHLGKEEAAMQGMSSFVIEVARYYEPELLETVMDLSKRSDVRV